MSMSLNERNPQTKAIPVGTQAATITLPVGLFRKHHRIKAAHLIDQAGVAADNTNYLTFSLQDASSTVYATYDSRAAGQGALTALTAKAMALPSPDLTVDAPSTPTAQQEVDVPAGTTLKLVITAHGTVTTTAALLQLEMYPL